MKTNLNIIMGWIIKMRNLIAILLTAAMLFGLCACGASDEFDVPDVSDGEPVVSEFDAALEKDENGSPDTEVNPIDYGDGYIPDSAVSSEPDENAPDPESAETVYVGDDIPAPRGYYASESGEYAMFFAPNTTTASAGELSLVNNEEVSAWGDYRTEEVVFGGEVNYYIWLTVKGLDEPVDDIHIATYYPADDAILQLEDIRTSDGMLSIGCPPADPDAESDFGTLLTNQDGV